MSKQLSTDEMPLANRRLPHASHWDPNWLHTTEEYYERCIPSILERAMRALEQGPRRVYSIESLFLLQRAWRSDAALHDRLSTLINQRRLRLTGTGITTPWPASARFGRRHRSCPKVRRRAGTWGTESWWWIPTATMW